MATIANQLNCESSYKNVGYGTCVLDPALIAGAILFNTKKSFTPSEVADLQTTLQDMAWADSPSARAFPINYFVAMTDNSEDVSIQTFDYGDKAITRDGVYDWSGQFRKGSLCLSSALRSLNGDRYVLFYDKNKVIYGYKSSDRLTTIPVLFYEKPWKLPTGSTATEYIARFIFLPNYLNEDVMIAKVAFDPAEITGLQDIDIIVNSFDSVTGVANITIQTLCGGVNLYDSYSTELAATGRYVVTNTDTGEAITVSTATAQASDKTFNVTLDVLDVDYPTAGTIDFTLAAPSALNVAGIPGYEAETAVLTVPSS